MTCGAFLSLSSPSIGWLMAPWPEILLHLPCRCAPARRSACQRARLRLRLRDVAFGFASLLAASLSAAAVLCRCSMGGQAQAGRLVSQDDEGARSFIREGAMVVAMVNAMLSGHARWL